MNATKMNATHLRDLRDRAKQAYRKMQEARAAAHAAEIELKQIVSMAYAAGGEMGLICADRRDVDRELKNPSSRGGFRRAGDRQQ